eukprot:11643452-Alexandrium_andersonii.AAC.1
MLPNQWTGSTVFRLKETPGAHASSGNPKPSSRTAAPALPDGVEFRTLGALLGAFSSINCPDSGPLASFEDFRICGLVNNGNGTR